MKKLLAATVAGLFSLSAAAYACDGQKEAAKGKEAKGDTVAKKETKDQAAKPEKTGDKSKS